MPPGPLWFFPCWLVSLASLSASWPSSTTPPLMGLTKHLQLASFSSFHVSSLAVGTCKPFWQRPSSFKPKVLTSPAGFFVLLAMAVYTGVTVNYYGKRYGSWRFSWSYIMGWVAVVLTFFSGRLLATLTNADRCLWLQVVSPHNLNDLFIVF